MAEDATSRNSLVTVTVDGITVTIDPQIPKKLKFFKLFRDIQKGPNNSSALYAVIELPEMLFGDQMPGIEAALSPDTDDLTVDVLYDFMMKVISEVGAKNS